MAGAANGMASQHITAGITKEAKMKTYIISIDTEDYKVPASNIRVAINKAMTRYLNAVASKAYTEKIGIKIYAEKEASNG